MWIDGHLDLAYLALNGRDLCVPCAAASGGCVSLPALRAGRVDVVLGTIYTAPGDDGPEGYATPDDLDGAERAGRAQLAVYAHLAEAGEITLVHDAADLETEGPRPAVVLLMEGADPIRDPAAVAAWHAAGLRVVGLTWARGTRYAGGNARGAGLTAAGRDLVAALDAHGIVHDASHLSDAAFDDLLGCAEGLVVATHSNCRALLDDSQRHLRDDQIRAIAARDGIVGLNLCGNFLARDGRATLDDCLDHVEHVAAVMGHRRGVALGSDADGGFTTEWLPAGVDHPERFDALADGLAARGWPPGDVDGFRSANWSRLLRRALSPSAG